VRRREDTRWCCQSAKTIEPTPSASITPEIGRVRKSHGSESVMSARTRFTSIWSPRVTPRISGASGKAAEVLLQLLAEGPEDRVGSPPAAHGTMSFHERPTHRQPPREKTAES
jgi:hypothetical protein